LEPVVVVNQALQRH